MLGGGTFTSQNKVLPGSYINVVSIGGETSTLGERGVVAVTMPLPWGNPGEVITVTADEFYNNSTAIFGYHYSAEEMLNVRELFKKAKKVHIYNSADGETSKAASCAYATAKKAGERGNALKVVIQTNIDDEDLFDVCLYLDTTLVFDQTVANSSELKDNAYVTWATGELAITAATPLTGGVTGSTAETSYQNALDAFESYRFNLLTMPGSNAETLIAYTKRMREELGVKFQSLVVGKDLTPDYEGVVRLLDTQSAAIYWVAGALAGCAENASCTNMSYDGELTVEEIPTRYTIAQLKDYIKKGVFMFHDVEGEIRVLVDINSLVTYTDEKNEWFASNQVVRVADGCAMDAARIFNNKYLGKIQNDNAGRVSFWNDIVTNRRERETIRAIDTYDTAALVVSPGEKRNSVVVDEVIVPISAMEKLYMTIVIK